MLFSLSLIAAQHTASLELRTFAGHAEAADAAVKAGVSPTLQNKQTAASFMARLTTLAFRVHHMERMEAFYSEAFGFTFRDVKTGSITSRFGAVGELTIKLVPIRVAPDFEEFPVHQPGFIVLDVNRVIAAAKKHGGVLLNAPERDGAMFTASVRDPDGNPVEIYQPLDK
jgi:catechol 2,3-dioxygenase-like lactoylglutathione lyase family enzyme